VLLCESQGYLNYGGNTHTYTRLAPNVSLKERDRPVVDGGSDIG
jgi:hypothetical protein